MINILLPVITILSSIYFITLLYLRSALKRVPLQQDNDLSIKNVSVIICARNEEHNLPDLVECLKNQNTGKLIVEFILVNDRSEDNTPQIIDSISKENRLFKALHILDRINGFAPKKRAIDSAIKQAKGEIILLTDADGRPGNQWLKTMISFFTVETDMVIGYAPYIVKNRDGIIKKMLALEYLSIAAIALATVAVGFPLTCVGTNMAYRKKVYQDIDGFGKYKSFISGDDDLFLTRVREAGIYKVAYAATEKCHVSNNPPKSWKQFINQRLRYASKGFDYPLKVTLFLATYVIFNLSLLTGLLASMAGNKLIITTSILAFILKALFEFLFMNKAAKIIGDNRFLKYFFPASLLHLPYILFFGIFGQFKLFKWAEKTVEYGISKTGTRNE